MFSSGKHFIKDGLRRVILAVYFFEVTKRQILFLWIAADNYDMRSIGLIITAERRLALT
jgi:hypothetical protein